jgi:UDP-glucose 4-epimerase
VTVLVTGGKGFIGARVIKNLVERGEKVICFELKATPGRLGDLARKITMVEGDIVNYDDIANAIARYRVDRIAHMVFFSAEERGVSDRPEKSDELYRQQMIMNTGTFHIFEAARLSGAKKLVYPSSIRYHGQDEPWIGPEPVNEDSPAMPTSAYGIGKHLCEHLAHEYNRLHHTDIVSVRVPIVYGPGVKIGARGVNLIGTEGALGQSVNFPYSPAQCSVLAHVDDVAEIIARALFARRLPHEVYHIGGHYTSYAELANIGTKLIPGMQVTFNESAPLICSYHIDCNRMIRDLGVYHRSLEDGYYGLINQTRKENDLSMISKGQ